LMIPRRPSHLALVIPKAQATGFRDAILRNVSWRQTAAIRFGW
jgi:hypothetical protein